MPALFGTAASADAATRYASPTSTDSSGNCATAGAACAIEHAIEGAGWNDEVIVLPGTYAIGATSIEPDNPVRVRGLSAAQRPTIIGSPAPLQGNVLEVKGGKLQDLRVESTNSETAISLQDSSTGERLIGVVSGAGGDAIGIQLKNGTNVLRDSLATSNAPGGAGLQIKDGTNLAVGVTAVGTGGADGLTSKTISGSASVKNSIVAGSADYDLDHGAATTFSSSNWRRGNSNGGVDGGGNQSAAPVFCADDTFRPAEASPTRGKGAADAAAGTTDLAGATRPTTGMDIGAYQYAGCPPPATSGPVTDGDSAGSGSDDAPTLPPASKPVLGATVKLTAVKGSLRVRLPGTKTFIPLTAESTVPVGAVIDASRGTVALTSVRDRSAKMQTGNFWGGMFQVRQPKRTAMTELVLRGGDFRGCRGTRRAARTDVSASRLRRGGRRRLWGSDRGGRFRTRGRHGSATVRGTRWLTEDRCGGTLFKVADGAIDVRDKARRKTVRVKRGKSYVAKPRAAGKKRARR